jgi:hypothetical protein
MGLLLNNVSQQETKYRHNLTSAISIGKKTLSRAVKVKGEVPLLN